LKVNQRFRRTYRLHLQGRRISRAESGDKQTSRLCELRVPVGSNIQPVEPVGDKKNITSLVLKRISCTALENYKGNVIGVWGKGTGLIWERSWVSGRHMVEDEGAEVKEGSQVLRRGADCSDTRRDRGNIGNL
jgi:hypothetical protein